MRQRTDTRTSKPTNEPTDKRPNEQPIRAAQQDQIDQAAAVQPVFLLGSPAEVQYQREIARLRTALLSLKLLPTEGDLRQHKFAVECVRQMNLRVDAAVLAIPSAMLPEDSV